MPFACGSSPVSTSASAGGSAVRPFEEIRATDLIFETDPSDPTRGIFHVTTKMPMICALVWGPDATFGRFNNSLSMNGTGIIEHDVVLPNVESGVTYSYTVEGAAADGKLYRSNVGTCRLGSTRTNRRRRRAT